MDNVSYKFIIGTVESFDSVSALIKDTKTGEKKLLRLSERKAVDMLGSAKMSGEAWAFAYSPDMVLMMCCPAEYLPMLTQQQTQ